MSTPKSKEKGGQPIPLEAIDQARIETNTRAYHVEPEDLKYTFNQNGLTLLLGPVVQELTRQGLKPVGNLVVTRRPESVDPSVFTPDGFAGLKIMGEPFVVVSEEQETPFESERLRGKVARTITLRGQEADIQYEVDARQWGWLPHKGSHQ